MKLTIMLKRRIGWMVLLAAFMVSCGQTDRIEVVSEADQIEGKLFIIGGGKRPAYLIEELIDEAAVRDSGLVLVMPMASSEEDTAAYYSSKQFLDLGVKRVLALSSGMIAKDLDSVRSLIGEASLIYISGGAQDKFMKAVVPNNLCEDIRRAYENGAVISGTSAGAAVMSSMMITGDQLKHPVYTGDFKTIEANNIILEEGLGLLSQAIVDQHFVQRQRLNRLISVVLENPDKVGLGIDESTALLVKDGKGIVKGESQVIVLRHPCAETKIVNGMIGGKEMSMDVLLPGDTICLENYRSVR